MHKINKILEDNKVWAESKIQLDKSFFSKLVAIQEPYFLWIGCSDSRVPANEITNTQPGEMFVHRNIANVVDINDVNLMSVVHYAVVYLKVKHIIVCGHYGCGGVKAAFSSQSFGIMDEWLGKIKTVLNENTALIDTYEKQEEKEKKLVELNVLAGVEKLKQLNTVIESGIMLHGWVYDLHDGILHRLS